MTLDQMVVTAKHALRFTGSRSVERLKDTDENILALRPLTGCSFNIAHADDSLVSMSLNFREGNMSAIARNACEFFHRLHATPAHIGVSYLESILIIS
jgi:hypothetical protein